MSCVRLKSGFESKIEQSNLLEFSLLQYPAVAHFVFPFSKIQNHTSRLRIHYRAHIELKL